MEFLIEMVIDLFLRKLFIYPGALLIWTFKGFKGSLIQIAREKDIILLFLLSFLINVSLIIFLIVYLN